MNVDGMLRELYLELANIDQAMLALKRLAVLEARKKREPGRFAVQGTGRKMRSHAAAVGQNCRQAD